MATYSNFFLTNSGKSLLGDLIGGNGEIEFRYLAVGSGIYGDEDKEANTLKESYALKSEKKRVPFSYIEKEKDGFVNLKASIDNAELSEGYLLTEVGVYAGKKDETDEVLYCISLAESPDYVSESSSGQPFSMIFNLTIGISDADKVTISYKPDAYALAEDLRHVSDKIGESDIAGIGDGTVTGAISALNSGFGGFSFHPAVLTQAEYDALPEETKQAEGMLFVIRKE